jgi:hypothetical protein
MFQFLVKCDNNNWRFTWRPSCVSMPEMTRWGIPTLPCLPWWLWYHGYHSYLVYYSYLGYHCYMGFLMQEIIHHPARQVLDTPPMQRSLTRQLSHHWRDSQRSMTKFWWIPHNCYTMHTFPDLFNFRIKFVSLKLISYLFVYVFCDISLVVHNAQHAFMCTKNCCAHSSERIKLKDSWTLPFS